MNAKKAETPPPDFVNNYYLTNKASLYDDIHVGKANVFLKQINQIYIYMVTKMNTIITHYIVIIYSFAEMTLY